MNNGMSYVEIGVSELARSQEFYGDLLGLSEGRTEQDSSGRTVSWLESHTGAVKLVDVGADGLPGAWQRDDLQCGIRHFGLKVKGIDAWADRLTKAGVEFAARPFDAFGGVRIAFFFDPDGSYLEFVEGYVQHNKLWSAELAQQEVDGDADWDGTPRFDHIAVTVPELDEALAFYRDRLDFGVVGQLVRPEDERGFLITNLRAGGGTLEVFTYTEPTHRRESHDIANRLGIRAVGVRVDALAAGLATGPGDVPLEVVA
jgi:catechol 2,3-dioxygenase-like lactoylglutathione lyase family enzyme